MFIRLIARVGTERLQLRKRVVRLESAVAAEQLPRKRLFTRPNTLSPFSFHILAARRRHQSLQINKVHRYLYFVIILKLCRYLLVLVSRFDLRIAACKTHALELV